MRASGNGGLLVVVPASEQQEILVALASLIRAERCGMAFDIIIEELQRLSNDEFIPSAQNGHPASFATGVHPDARRRFRRSIDRTNHREAIEYNFQSRTV